MLDLPFEKWTLGDALAQRVQQSGDAPFIRMVGGEALGFRQLQAQVLGLAEVLQRAGVSPGDRVVVMGGNCLATLRCWFALNLLGAIDVTINTAYRGRPLEHAINTAQARLMLIGARHIAVLAESERALPLLERALYFDDQPDMPAQPADGIRLARVALAPLPAPAPPSAGWQAPGARAQDLASIIFTSGTSGPAKGVMLPHAQTYLVSLESAQQLQVREDDVYYIFHPLFHMSPRYVAIYAALIAGAQVCMDRGFSAADWLPRIRACGATVSIGHGPMLEMIHATPERDDDADNPLRRLATSPFPWHIAADFERRFGIRGLEVWGMTEVNIPLWNSLDEPLRRGCGRPISHEYDLALVDPDTDLPVPAGTAGEIVVRGRRPWTLMQGYFGMPEATQVAWRNLWFHTGDLAWKDADGYYHFVDRLGDRIRRRAENISSYEIEVAAMQHPSVRECAAVGVPSEFASDDDVLLAVVPAAEFDAQVLLTHLARVLPHFMVPRYIDTLDELPRTPTNKVRKVALRQRGVQPTTWDRKAKGVDLRALAKG